MGVKEAPLRKEDMSRQQIGELVDKYKIEIEREMGLELSRPRSQFYSREYQQFKKEYLPGRLSLYEKACSFSEKLLNLKPDPKKAAALQRAIDTCHLEITPAGATSFSMLAPLLIILFGSIFSYLIFQSFFFVFFFIIGGALLYMPLSKLPFFIADNWRLKASNQMVLCIFYIVTYMRHTSNLENAMDFAAEHLGPPLSLDLKKVLWDVETGEYSSVKESLDHYLELWREHNGEFVEAVQLVESSLYESSEARRLEVLDKSLDVILTGTYEKMLHYAHDLKSPITMLNMLGVIMPILGLVILPLVVSFMEEAEWYHIAALYNVVIPISVYYMGRVILSKRPTGYGDTDITELNPELKKYKKVIIKLGKKEIQINPLFIAGFVLFFFLFIGFLPLIIHSLDPSFDVVLYGYGSDLKIGIKSSLEEGDLRAIKYYFLDYKLSSITNTASKKYNQIVGPFGIGAAVLSIFIVIGIGFSIGIYYRLKSMNVIVIRQKTKELEKEFSSALFQLGNRIGDGLPAELAFERVSISMKDSVSGKFFELVSINLRKLGMGLQQAIFNPKVGALLSFPSGIIESSMKILIQSSRKGPLIAAQSLMNISRYIKEIHNVDERLKDLLGETITSMKSQISFMTPAIAGIVIGITSMISTILGKLGTMLATAQENTGEGAPKLPELFGDGIPTYYFVIVVGLYVIQIVYILTILANGIENGEDRMNEHYQLGQNLVKSTLKFCIISLIIMIIFNVIATSIITKTLGM